MVDITDTSVDVNGLERLLSDFKTLKSLKVSNTVWNSFFNRLSQDHFEDIIETNNDNKTSEICLECVGVCNNMIDINFEGMTWKYISLISEIFPNLKHLTLNLTTLFRSDNILNLSDVIMSMEMCLPELKKQTSMTVISNNLHFNVLRPCISSADCGHRLTEVVFVGNKSSVIDVAELDQACPNLEILCISNASITFNRDLLSASLTYFNGVARYFLVVNYMLSNIISILTNYISMIINYIFSEKCFKN